ncbi:MAG: LytTR family DNA-binding domain-containing protein [Gammaproteobacteria bacterium]|nr:LytTR family DNA-binding domain-containing protein [Gammaproteobacteria bacterium]
MYVLIVDDEPLARKRLRQLMDNFDGYNVVAEAENGEQALHQVQALKPDIILLDIRMPGMDGIETAHHLSKLSKPPAVIFTTAYSDHALEAFSTHAVDYVLKPIKQERLKEALDAARRPTRAQLKELNAEDDNVRKQMCVKIRGRLELIPVDEIRYFQADHKYVTMKTDAHEYLIEESLKSLETEFGDSFTRIHRNALIADHFIVGMTKTNDGQNCILLDGIDDKLEISRRHLALVRKKLKMLASQR